MNYSTMSFDEFKNFCAAVKSLEPNAKFSVDKNANTLTWHSAMNYTVLSCQFSMIFLFGAWDPGPDPES